MKTFRNFIIKLSCILIVVSVLSITIFDHSNRGLFGFKIVSVPNDEMSKIGINHDDLVVVQEIDPSTIKEGDIISFRSLNKDNYFEILTHKVRSRTIDETDYPGFITYSVDNEENDERIVNYEYILGKHACTIKGAGVFFKFLKSTFGYVTCIFLPFFILIFNFIISRIHLDKSITIEKEATTRIEKFQNVSSKKRGSKNVSMPKLNKSKQLVQK